MKYADFDYYQNVYLGDMVTDEEQYDALAVKAGSEVEYYTLGKSKDHSADDAVKMASCAVVEQLAVIRKAQRAALSESGELQSESVGGYSRAYRSNADSVASAKSEIRNVVQKYLATTGLLYRGCNACSRRTQ